MESRYNYEHSNRYEFNLTGFALNSYHFFNTSFNEHVAKKLTCRTGLNYILDTSRNGGKFSRQNEEDIQRCLFDPPEMEKVTCLDIP